ncbi:MAG: hypothetical protein KJ985_14315, partial [Proteobacteria bacterium]|nr:hypothetical protein [Pseudomonadota bacterium]
TNSKDGIVALAPCTDEKGSTGTQILSPDTEKNKQISPYPGRIRCKKVNNSSTRLKSPARYAGPTAATFDR